MQHTNAAVIIIQYPFHTIQHVMLFNEKAYLCLSVQHMRGKVSCVYFICIS